ncbi:MAG: septum formation initiator family protein [Ruminococcaceae bacterium]|nr:septum formation initiator family protein [Oscillospiraceae bacterium]
MQGAPPEEGGAHAVAAKAKKQTGIFALALVLLMIFVVGMRLMGMREKLASAQAEREMLTERVAKARQENRSLEAALDRAEDPEYLQQLAREKLGMVSPGEKDFYDVSRQTAQRTGP